MGSAPEADSAPFFIIGGLHTALTSSMIPRSQERGLKVSEEKNSNVVRISDEAYAAVKREAKEKDVSVGQAATLLLMRGDNRKRALNRYNKRVKAGEITPLSKKEADKTRKVVTKTKAKATREAAAKEAAKLAKQKVKAKATKKSSKKKAESAPAVLNGVSESASFAVEEG